MTPPAIVKPARRPRWGRALSFVGAWVVIIVIGRAVVPASSRADTKVTRGTPEGAVIGSLVGRDYIVRITTGDSGPRYTVTTLSGQVLQANLDAAGLAKAFPHVDPTTLQASPGAGAVGQLMHADTGEKLRD